MPRKSTRTAPIGRRGLSEQLRDAIADCGLTAYALGQQAGVDPGVVHRFLTGQRDIRMATADQLADALGLRLVADGRRQARARTGRTHAPAAGPAEGPGDRPEPRDP